MNPSSLLQENGNRSNPVNFSAGVKPTIQGRNIDLPILGLRSHLKVNKYYYGLPCIE